MVVVGGGSSVVVGSGGVVVCGVGTVVVAVGAVVGEVPPGVVNGGNGGNATALRPNSVTKFDFGHNDRSGDAKSSGGRLFVAASMNSRQILAG